MSLRRWSLTWFHNHFEEDVFGYIERKFFSTVRQYLGKMNGVILDAACGRGNAYLERLYFDKSLLVGIDIDPTVKEKNTLHKKFIIEDLHHLDTKQRFEGIISVYTWEHLHSPDLVLKRFHDVLSETGALVIVAPQRWHYVSAIGLLIPNQLKDLAWRLLKGHAHMPYPIHHKLCSRKSLCLEASRQGFKVEHYSSVEGPPIWFAMMPPLFVLASFWMSFINKHKVFENFRSTFLAVLKKA